MSVPVVVGLCFTPSALFGLALLVAGARCRLDDRDRCQRIVVLTERDAADRLRSGAAWIEAYALQLDEIQALPEVEPRRWVA